MLGPPAHCLASAPVWGLACALAGVCPRHWSGGSGREATCLFHLLPRPCPGGLAIHSSLCRCLLKEPIHHLPVPRDLESFLQLLRTPHLERGTEGPWKNLTPQVQGETPPHLFCHQMSGVRFHLLGRGDVMGHLSQLRAPRGPSVMTTFGQGLRTVTKRWEVDLASQQGGSRHRGGSRLEEARWGKQHVSIS